MAFTSGSCLSCPPCRTAPHTLNPYTHRPGVMQALDENRVVAHLGLHIRLLPILLRCMQAGAAAASQAFSKAQLLPLRNRRCRLPLRNRWNHLPLRNRLLPRNRRDHLPPSHQCFTQQHDVCVVHQLPRLLVLVQPPGKQPRAVVLPCKVGRVRQILLIMKRERERGRSLRSELPVPAAACAGPATREIAPCCPAALHGRRRKRFTSFHHLRDYLCCGETGSIDVVR